ncbi:hypothetical protein [Streptomyces sp. NPDC001792]|uniref:hypothetical protein n=1 Tax=unclassified Streptomyces TaxID=2593676 RepID=UPI0033276255
MSLLLHFLHRRRHVVVVAGTEKYRDIAPGQHPGDFQADSAGGTSDKGNRLCAFGRGHPHPPVVVVVAALADAVVVIGRRTRRFVIDAINVTRAPRSSLKAH